jgi:hypothetical protein
VALVAVVGATTLSGCSEEKEKGEQGKASAASSGDCARCEKEKAMLSSKLRATQNQVRKLKKQLKVAKRAAKRKVKSQ